MLAYSIFRGVQRGWLDESYLSHANRMRDAAHEKVDEFGLVQGVCGAPNFDRSGTATEGQAFFLLMEAAYTDMYAAERHRLTSHLFSQATLISWLLTMVCIILIHKCRTIRRILIVDIDSMRAQQTDEQASGCFSSNGKMPTGRLISVDIP